MRTLLIKIDKDSSLKAILDLVDRLKLKAKVVGMASDLESEHDEWLMLNVQNFSNGYADDEPDISHLELKEPNADYNPD